MSTIITPKATLSYPHLDKAQEPKPGDDGNGKAKFSATLVFAPGTDLTALFAAAFEAAKEKFTATFKLPNGQMVPIEKAFELSILRSPFRRDALVKGYPEGSIFINVRTERKPGCVFNYKGADGKPAIIPDEAITTELYAGASVRASVRAFGYEAKGNRGVSFALNNVQKLGDGERLDGRVAASDEFTAELDAAPSDLSALM